MRRDVPKISAALLAAGKFRRGKVHRLEFRHDERCPYPWGGRCFCVRGPETLLDGERVEVGES